MIFNKGDDEKFFLGYLAGPRGLLRRRMGQMLLFREGVKYNLDFVKGDKNKKNVKKLSQDDATKE